MTREEAIQELQNCKGLIQQDGQDYLDERDIPLLDMAIEALSVANLKEEFESADAVSREEYDFKKNLERINKGILSASKKLEDKGLFKRVDFVEVVRCKDCLYKQLMDEGDTKYYYCALEDRPNRMW